jgi:predicted alpha/beta hydrolase family esterase
MEKLPFPSVVVASSDDPFVTIERARQFANAWGSKLVEIGAAGHVNADTGFGEWPQGEQMLSDFCDEISKNRASN